MAKRVGQVLAKSQAAGGAEVRQATNVGAGSSEGNSNLGGPWGWGRVGGWEEGARWGGVAGLRTDVRKQLTLA